jgi:hypothetical protein
VLSSLLFFLSLTNAKKRERESCFLKEERKRKFDFEMFGGESIRLIFSSVSLMCLFVRAFIMTHKKTRRERVV